MIWSHCRRKILALADWSALCAAVVCFVVSATQGTAHARPAYGNNCSSCHGSGGFGNTVPNALIDVVAPSQSTIPPGAFGDPDRGEGPLPTYTSVPGGTFSLAVQIKDTSTYTPAFVPTRWALALQDIYHTDPDYQLGNPDPLSWRDGQLLLAGAMEPAGAGPEPAPIPANAAEWWRYTNSQARQYYASTSDAGHDWTGALLVNLTVSVPASVLPGWYDLEVSGAGWDFSRQFAFYDDEHYYLNVVPEPGGLSLLLVGSQAMLGGRLLRRKVRRTPKPFGI